MKKFDLNIERILENWEVKHAVREIIANALDEQKLSNTSDIQIFKRHDTWIIKDFGRGLKYDHFTQKENDEKLSAIGVIGKFGIGLKDAFATFERKGVSLKIFSKHGDITLGKSRKNGFDDLITLHAYIAEPTNPYMLGTEFHLSDISDNDIEEGKKLFLKFNAEQVIETTRIGSVLKNFKTPAKIYINGVLVATEDSFLFSYNITSINSQLNKAINRERMNVGRTAYAGIIRSILLECKSKEIGEELSNDLKLFSSGSNHDELKWIDVQNHAVKILNEYQSVVFVTSDEIQQDIDLIEEAREGGASIVVIPSNLRDKIISENENKDNDNKIRTFQEFIHERNENFEFNYIDECDLTYDERAVFSSKEKLFEVIGGKPLRIKDIVISETMGKDLNTFFPAAGLWQANDSRIIIKRSVLQDRQHFYGVLLHEVAHASSGASDATRSFESELTRLLGVLASNVIL